MITIIPLVISALWASTPQNPDVSLDVWTGTLELQNDELYLKRCGSGQNIYLLKPLGEHAAGDIPLEEVKAGVPVTATLIAAYESRADGSDALLVESVDDVAIGKSCHLLDLLRGRDGAS